MRVAGDPRLYGLWPNVLPELSRRRRADLLGLHGHAEAREEPGRGPTATFPKDPPAVASDGSDSVVVPGQDQSSLR